jgi:hypothetical protein
MLRLSTLNIKLIDLKALYKKLLFSIEIVIPVLEMLNNFKTRYTNE